MDSIGKGWSEPRHGQGCQDEDGVEKGPRDDTYRDGQCFVMVAPIVNGKCNGPKTVNGNETVRRNDASESDGDVLTKNAQLVTDDPRHIVIDVRR